jgi:hypothetical protein
MQAILRFDCSDPDDAREHRYCLAGRDALIALDVIDNRCRSLLKHGEPSPETERVLEELRSLIPHELVELLV